MSVLSSSYSTSVVQIFNEVPCCSKKKIKWNAVSGMILHQAEYSLQFRNVSLKLHLTE